jgi:hypothetical protein
LVVATGKARVQTMRNSLRQMPKPGRAVHGGKGLFRFCSELSYRPEHPTSLLDANWRSANDSALTLLS